MHRLNTCSACLGGKGDILVTEQLFLKFICNFGGEACTMTNATPETDVRKRMFSIKHLLAWLPLVPLVFT